MKHLYKIKSMEKTYLQSLCTFRPDNDNIFVNNYYELRKYEAFINVPIEQLIAGPIWQCRQTETVISVTVSVPGLKQSGAETVILLFAVFVYMKWLQNGSSNLCSNIKGTVEGKLVFPS